MIHRRPVREDAALALRGRRHLMPPTSPIADRCVVRERLPSGWVHYPPRQGSLIGFQDGPGAPVRLCACAEPALAQLIHFARRSKVRRAAAWMQLPSGLLAEVVPELRELAGGGEGGGSGIDPLRSPGRRRDAAAVLDPVDPRVLGDLPLAEDRCHRCQRAVPSRRFCGPGEGSRFLQSHGWYVQQVYLRNGVDLVDLKPRARSCPAPLLRILRRLHRVHAKLEQELERRFPGAAAEEQAMLDLPRADPYGLEAPDRLERLRWLAPRCLRAVRNQLESEVRLDFGLAPVGEGLIAEPLLALSVARLFPDEPLRRRARPRWLGGLELDLYLPERELAIEFQGEQHFAPVEAWGGELALLELQRRDRRKRELCRERGVRLVELRYDQPLGEESLRRAIAASESGAE